MAITRAQQAKQLLANGGISLQEAKDMAPKGEFLAYINSKEAKMLKDAGGSGIMTNAGIPSFVEYGGPSGFDSAKSTGSVGGDVDRGRGDKPNMRDIAGPITTITNPVYGDPDPEVDVPTKDRKDTITSYTDNLKANLRSNPFSMITPLGTLLQTAYQTAKVRDMLGLTTNDDDDDDDKGNEGGGS